MSPQEMADAANQAIKFNTRIILNLVKGVKAPAGFPRGDLLCENPKGDKVYSYDPEKIIEWLNKNRLIAIEIL